MASTLYRVLDLADEKGFIQILTDLGAFGLNSTLYQWNKRYSGNIVLQRWLNFTLFLQIIS